MDALRGVGHHHEDGGRGLGLGDEVEAGGLAALGRRGVSLQDFLEEAVEGAGRHPLVERLVDLHHRLQQRGHAAAGLGREALAGGVGDEGEFFPATGLDGGDLLGVAEVGLVEPDEDASPPVDGEAQDLGVLLRDALGGIDHQHHDVGPLDGAHRQDHAGHLHGAVLLDDLGLAADAGGVDQDEAVAVALDQGIDGVAGGPGAVVDEHPLLAGQPVDQGGFPCVGPPDDRHPDQPVGLRGLAGAFGGHGLDQRRLELAHAPAVERADREDLLEPHPVEVGGLRLQPWGIGLVGHVEHRLGGAPQQVDGVAVGVGRPGGRVQDADDHVRLVDGHLHVAVDALLHRVIAPRVEASGVDQGVMSSAEEGVGVVAVAGHPGLVVDDGQPLPHQPVEQGALADVGPPDHRHHRARPVQRRPRRERELFRALVHDSLPSS